jgi:Flp pilus assembly pilin Flp
MNRIKSYLKRFAKDEDGAELIEVAIAIALVAAVAAIIFVLIQTVGGKVEEAQTMIEGIDVPDLSGGAGGP